MAASIHFRRTIRHPGRLPLAPARRPRHPRPAMRTNSLAVLSVLLAMTSASAATQRPYDDPRAELLRMLAPLALANPTGMSVAEARAAVRARPRDADAWNQLGQSLDVAGRLAESVAAHERATRLPPRLMGRAFLWRDLAELRERTGDLPGAIAAARVSIRSWPLSRDGLHCAGVEVRLLTRLLVRTNDMSGALAFYAPLARRSPDRADCRDISETLEDAAGA